MRWRTLVVGFLAVMTLLASPAISQSSDPWIGTWKLNPAKSKFSPGPALRSSTVTIVALDGGIKQTVDSVPASWGLPTKSESWAKFDGQDNPVKGNPNTDTVAFTKIDGRTFQVVSKKAGKITLTSRVVISTDGKTGTVTQAGTNAQGQAVSNLLAYDRQ